MAKPIATVTSRLDPVGIAGRNNPNPPGAIAVGAKTVYANNLPVALLGSKCIWHGNPINPKAPGYNPLCAQSFVTKGSSTVYVEGVPVARLGDVTLCGHYILGPSAAPNIQVGPD